MTIKFYLTRADSDAETSIYARISYQAGTFKYYTTEKIHPKNWNLKKQLARETENFKECMEFNTRIRKIKSDIENTLRTYQNDNESTFPNVETFKALLDLKFKNVEQKKEKKKEFIEFFQAVIERSRKGVRLNLKTGKPISKSTIKSYTTTLNHLLAFQETSKRKIEFSSIDLDFYDDYNAFLMDGKMQHKKTKKIHDVTLSTNSIGKDIKNIKTVLSEATDKGLNTNLTFKNKRFAKLREETYSIYLSEAELAAIEALNLTENKKLDRVRDSFLIGCHTGLRFSDWFTIKPELITGGFIDIKQTKTLNPVCIPVHPTVENIISKYNGKIPDSISNQKMNDYLKELGAMAECLKATVSTTMTKGGLEITENFEKWQLLCTHTARRSFCTNEYLAGTPILEIMAISGHKTESAFLGYIKVTPQQHAENLKKRWEERRKLRLNQLRVA